MLRCWQKLGLDKLSEPAFLRHEQFYICDAPLGRICISIFVANDVACFFALLYWLVSFHDRLGLTNSSWPASFNISHGEYSTNTRAPRRSPHTFVIDLHIWECGWVTIYVPSLISPPRYIIYHVPPSVPNSLSSPSIFFYHCSNNHSVYPPTGY